MLVIISERTAWWKDHAVRLNQKGIFAFLASYEQGLRYCKTRATGGVVIDCVRHLKHGEELCHRLHSLYPELPLAALVCTKAVPNMPVSRLLRETQEEDLFDALLDFCVTTCGWETGPLSTHALTVGNIPSKTVYMGCVLSLTERESLILRCLFYRAPKITSAKDLTRLCYPGQTRSAGNLAVHIQSINQKASLIDPRPLIVNERAKGYRLRDGILL